MLGAATGSVLCALAMVAALVLGGRHATAPNATAQALCADLQAQGYAHVYTVLSPQLQAEGTQEQFVASQAQLDTLKGKVTACSYVVQQADNSQATLALHLTRARTPGMSGTVRLVYLSGTWRIADYDGSAI